MSNVTYVAPNRTDAGAVPRGTIVETEIQPDGSNRQVIQDTIKPEYVEDDDDILLAWFTFMRQPYE